MKLWMVCTLLLLVMLAVLAVLANVSVPPISAAIPWYLLLSFVLLILLSQYLSRSLKQIVHHSKLRPKANFRRNLQTHSKADIKNKNHQLLVNPRSSIYSAFINELLNIIGSVGIAALSTVVVIIAFVSQTLVGHQQAFNNELRQPQRVIATVKIIGISDSVYNESLDSNYRQLAVIQSAIPMTQTLEQTFKITPKQPFNKHPVNNSSSLSSFQFDDHQSSSKFNMVNVRVNPSDPNYLAGLTGKRILLSSFGNGTASNFGMDMAMLNQLAPNQLATMVLDLSMIPPAKDWDSLRGSANSTSKFQTTKFDEHKWLRSRHIDAKAKIMALADIGHNINSNSNNRQSSSHFSSSHVNNKSNWLDKSLLTLQDYLQSGRYLLRQHFVQNWSELNSSQQQAKAVTLSLLTGDRALIDTSTKDLYQLAGISHLLAISGTHILFLAIMVSMFFIGMVNRFIPKLYFMIARWQLRWLIMISVSAVYALFTGFDVPAARTLWMLIAVGIARLLLVRISSYGVLIIVAVIMAWFDAYVLWQAGFWLSFVAVMLLIGYEDSLSKLTQANRNKSKPNHSAIVSQLMVTLPIRRIVFAMIHVTKLQLLMFISLLPVSLLLFGKVSWWGLLVNLVAIGLYGWLIVPINLLAGILYPISANMANILWAFDVNILQFFHGIISDGLTDNQAWIYTKINAGMLIICGLALLPWFLPKGLMNRLMSLPPLMILVMVLFNQTHRSEQKPTLTLFTSTDTYFTTQVLQIGDENWLIVSDALSLNNRYKRHIDSDKSFSKLTDKLVVQWQQNLGVLGVNRLTGVIVQSPNAVLNQATIQLSKKLPIGQIWQADSKAITLVNAGPNKEGSKESNTKGEDDENNKASRAVVTYLEALSNPQLDAMQNAIKPFIKTPIQECQSGMVWHNDNNSFRIQAVTGWQNIDNLNMRQCAILVDSKYKIKVNSDQQLSTMGFKMDDSKKTVSLEPLSINRLLLDTATDKKLWQVWSMLCPTDKQVGVHKLQRYSTDWTVLDTLLLSHSSSAISMDIIKMWKIKQLMVTDTKDKYNQIKIEQKQLEFSNETKPIDK